MLAGIGAVVFMTFDVVSLLYQAAGYLAAAALGGLVTIAVQGTLKKFDSDKRRRVQRAQARFYLRQLLKVMSVARDFSEEQMGGEPLVELAGLRALVLSQDIVLTDGQRDAIFEVISALPESMQQIEAERGRLASNPTEATAVIRASAQRALATIYTARRQCDDYDAVRWPSPNNHTKWSINDPIPGSAENAEPIAKVNSHQGTG